MNIDWLRTLIAVVDEGSFEAAADELQVSPSAVSQRVKAMEREVGRMLVRRTQPCTVTDAGEVLLRTARQVVLLTTETLTELGRDHDGQLLRVAVNADSLATWFASVLVAAGSWSDVVLQLEVEDQDHSAGLLRRGDVVAAVSASPLAVAGCRTRPLGSMRYLPVASPGLVDRFGDRKSGLRWAELPALRYNTKDDLQLGVLRRLGITQAPPQPQVPGSEAFLAGVLAGLGWGMVPQAQIADHLESGRLVRLPAPAVSLPLYWQVWSVDSPRLARLGDAVLAAARAGLDAP